MTWAAGDRIRRAAAGAWEVPTALLALCIYISVLAGGAYGSFEHFRLADPRGGYDAIDYVHMYRGEIIDTKHRYRFLIPYVARAVPVQSLTWAGTDISSRPAEFAFLVINVLQMLAAAAVLHAALRRIGFAWLEVVVGCSLFLAAPPSISAAGLPMVDASTYLAAAITLWAIVARSGVALGITLFVGVFAREPIVVLALAAGVSRRFPWWLPVVLAVGVTASWLGYKVVYDSMHPYHSQASTFTNQTREVLKQYAQAHLAHEVAIFVRTAAMTYLGAGALAVFGWPLRDRLPGYLRSMTWWLAFCGVFGFVLGNFDRISFIGFPALLPFSLLGLKRLTGDVGPQNATSAPT